MDNGTATALLLFPTQVLQVDRGTRLSCALVRAVWQLLLDGVVLARQCATTAGLQTNTNPIVLGRRCASRRRARRAVDVVVRCTGHD